MDLIPEVEAAKTLMNEAVSWSVMKWLSQKKSVRKSADLANAALDQRNELVKAQWDEELRIAYQTLSKTNGKRIVPEVQAIDRELTLFARKVKEADDEAYRARMDAEQTFDAAERQLSTTLAREGCRKAILSWDLHEKAIRKAEAGIRQRNSQSTKVDSRSSRHSDSKV